MSLKEKEERDAVCYGHCANRKRWKYFSRKVHLLLRAQVIQKEIIIVVTQKEMREADMGQ